MEALPIWRQRLITAKAEPGRCLISGEESWAPLHWFHRAQPCPYIALIYIRFYHFLASYIIIETNLWQGGLEMATERRTLTIQLLPDHAELLEQVARLRTGQTDPAGPVDLGAYFSSLADRDIAACLEEIRIRRGG